MNALEMMKSYPPSIAATKKYKGNLPDGFAWYSFAWLGDNPSEFEIMKIEGAMTKIAKTGKNKGTPIFDRSSKKQTVYVTSDDINQAFLSSESK
jgi:hypothetical protein